MHAVVQSLEVLVVAMAAAAFAHFGVSLKDAAVRRAPEAVVHRIPVASVTPAMQVQAGRRAPCSLTRSIRRA